MLSPHIKKKVDQLWNMFWSAGITNPLVAIEQITYLLFLKRLEGLDNERVKKGKTSIYAESETCRWSFIKQDRSPKHLGDTVFPWLRELEKKFSGSDNIANGIASVSNRMSDAYFQLDPNKGTILSEAIELIDSLFERVDTIGATSDIMGDTFEYLLSEISTAGKNGQFRTPRHIIRLMVELLNPKPGARVIDPAAGTGGFLFSTLNYILIRNTNPEQLRIEWDGTPHRVYGDLFTPAEYQDIHGGVHYIGFDNDRTMVRIGWMNMVLHGIEDPQIHQRDSLARPKEDDPLRDLLHSESADYVLANPPFTGSVDTGDLDLSAFPKSGKSGKRASQAITGKSELLFVWRMLDLLRVGGKCAVIVPEGVLFGNTDAHVSLRRELLTEHLVEAIISLPAGVFQPYTGVKTAILLFQKETRKEDRGKWKPIDPPRTQQVWFYEVNEEAFTLDAKRDERRGQNNDLWDVVAKYLTRNDINADPLVYYQPDYHVERWRTIDKRTLEVFSDNPEVQRWKDQVAAIHELFTDLPVDPGEAEAAIKSKTAMELEELIRDYLFESAVSAAGEIRTIGSDQEKHEIVENHLKKAATPLRSLCNQQKHIFDQGEQEAWPIFLKSFLSTIDHVVENLTDEVAKSGASFLTDRLVRDVPGVIERIAKEFSKLDGYDVMLRALEAKRQKDSLAETKSWQAPVRVYVDNGGWQSADGRVKGNHDEKGKVRAEYSSTVNLYDEKGKVVEGLLDPECIEARGWNLSAGQYKPFTFTAVKSQKSVVEMIQELKVKEQKISEGLDGLLRVVEARE